MLILAFNVLTRRVQPDDIGAHINLGRTYNSLKMFKEAEDAYLEVRIYVYLINVFPTCTLNLK